MSEASPDVYRQLFETAPDAMIVVGPDGVIDRANPQAGRLFGYSHEALAGQPIEMLMPEGVRRAHVGHRERYTQSPRVRHMGAGQDLIGRRSDGTQFPVEIALSPLTSLTGPLFVASIRDISETQRARQALARARYDARMTEVGQLALESPNGDDGIERIANAVANELGVEVVAVVLPDAHGRPQLRAIGELPRERADALAQMLPAEPLLAHVLATAQPISFGSSDVDEAIVSSELRALGYASGACVPLVDVSRPMGALLALSATAKVFDRDAIHFLNSVASALAAAVQRSRTLEQLAHAQRLDAVGQLTGGIAHDFNNLLTVVSGNLQVLEPELADRPEALALIGNALRAVGRGAELTGKLLAFARRQRLTPRPLSPQALLAELSAMLGRTLGEQLAIEIACAPGVRPVFADAGQLDAALINLALNARDAMPRGGRLRIAAREQIVLPGEGDGTPGDYIVFAVSDTGLGMAPEVLRRAFEPFFTTKAPGKGSGLGLSMVYGFVTQSGGHLAVESNLGYGTMIEMFLPRATALAPVVSRASGERVLAGSETVLVVEDEPEVRGIATAFLRALGYHTIEAADAAAAIELAARHPDIAVLFSDVALGAGRNGRELAHELRRTRPGLAVLLTSGFDPGAEADGEFTLLPKPYRREDLAQSLRTVLDRRS